MSILKLSFTSYGLKRNRATNYDYPKYLIPRADIILDCRCLEDFRTDVTSTEVELFIEMVIRHLRRMKTRRNKNKDPFRDRPVHVLLVCAWGVNRSVSMREMLVKRFKNDLELRMTVFKILPEITDIRVSEYSCDPLL